MHRWTRKKNFTFCLPTYDMFICCVHQRTTFRTFICCVHQRTTFRTFICSVHQRTTFRTFICSVHQRTTFRTFICSVHQRTTFRTFICSGERSRCSCFAWGRRDAAVWRRRERLGQVTWTAAWRWRFGGGGTPREEAAAPWCGPGPSSAGCPRSLAAPPTFPRSSSRRCRPRPSLLQDTGQDLS